MTDGKNGKTTMIGIDINIETSSRFKSYLTDWLYGTYLLIGGYGSGKSHNTVTKILLKALSEKVNIMAVRKTYASHRNSTFELFKKILKEWHILETNPSIRRSRSRVLERRAPMELHFPNGSKIIFQGLDNVENIKSTDGISIVWIEECDQITEKQYSELVLRIREPGKKLHFLLTCNPVSLYNWVYTRFFVRRKTIEGIVKEKTIVDPNKFYECKTLVNNDVYYHHSTVDDNKNVPKEYIKKLDEMKEYDQELYVIARHGKFGVSGRRVLPQFKVAENAIEFKRAVNAIPQIRHFTGFDFGFEESYNALVQYAIDEKTSTMLIYNEVYENGVTDDVFCMRPKMQEIKEKQRYYEEKGISYNPIVADSSSPKDIKYYRNQGFRIRKCQNRGIVKNNTGSRVENTKKVKRVKHIICSPACTNTIRELQQLVYKEDKNGVIQFDQFDIDPHTFSAIWYGWDTYELPSLKYDDYMHKNNSYQ